MSGVLLFAIAGLEAGERGPLAPGTELVVYRDVGAVVAELATARGAEDTRDVERYRAVIDAVFARHPVLPAPVGVVFRSRDTLERWLHLHYASFSEGLAFVEGRAVARVHVGTLPDPLPGDADLQGLATEVLRGLRRHAAAAIPGASGEAPGTDLATGAFLVERARWEEFVAAVAEATGDGVPLAARVTGPWPPYDFIRLQFGG